MPTRKYKKNGFTIIEAFIDMSNDYQFKEFTCPECGYVGAVGNPPAVWAKVKSFSLAVHCDKCRSDLTVSIVGADVRVEKK